MLYSLLFKRMINLGFIVLLPITSSAAGNSQDQLQQEFNLLKQQVKKQQQQIKMGQQQFSNQKREIATLNQRLAVMSNGGKSVAIETMAPGALNLSNTSGLRGATTVTVVPNPPSRRSPYYTGKPQTIPPKSGEKDKFGHWSGLFPVGTALYLRENYNNFYSIVTQNGARSYASRNFCFRGTLCFSGLMNLDMKFYDRHGSAEDFNNIGSSNGQGFRPVFGDKQPQIIGSFNNADLFVDAGVNNWVMTHLDFAYVNGANQVRQQEYQGYDWGSVYRNGAALKVNEAYGVLANPAATPFYVKLGRFYEDFGDYQLFPITLSLTQLIEQARTGGIQGGLILPSGLYASVYYTMAQQSLENINDLGFVNTGTNQDRNFGGKVGYRGQVDSTLVNVNASFVRDMRDSDYFSGLLYSYNQQFRLTDVGGFFAQNQYLVMKRTPGMAFHGNIQSGRFGLGVDYVTALKNLNPEINSRIHALSVNGNVDFLTFQHPSQFQLGFQEAWQARIFRPIFIPFIPPFEINFPLDLINGPLLPEYRYTASYSMLLLPNLNVSAQWVHDMDFSPNKGGNGRSSNMGVLRVSLDI